MLDEHEVVTERDGEKERIVGKDEIRAAVAKNIELIGLLSDIQSGFVTVSYSEYQALPHNLVEALTLWRVIKAEQLEHDKPRNRISPHP